MNEKDKWKNVCTFDTKASRFLFRVPLLMDWGCLFASETGLVEIGGYLPSLDFLEVILSTPLIAFSFCLESLVLSLWWLVDADSGTLHLSSSVWAVLSSSNWADDSKTNIQREKKDLHFEHIWKGIAPQLPTNQDPHAGIDPSIKYVKIDFIPFTWIRENNQFAHICL